jgi:hypothetical protein
MLCVISRAVISRHKTFPANYTCVYSRIGELLYYKKRGRNKYENDGVVWWVSHELRPAVRRCVRSQFPLCPWVGEALRVLLTRTRLAVAIGAAGRARAIRGRALLSAQPSGGAPQSQMTVAVGEVTGAGGRHRVRHRQRAVVRDRPMKTIRNADRATPTAGRAHHQLAGVMAVPDHRSARAVGVREVSARAEGAILVGVMALGATPGTVPRLDRCAPCAFIVPQVSLAHLVALSVIFPSCTTGVSTGDQASVSAAAGTGSLRLTAGCGHCGEQQLS